MKRYTIGIMFNYQGQEVLLIQKTKPEWQKGLLNAPGGKVEEGEIAEECIVREFRKETGLITEGENWMHMGQLINADEYKVDVLTCMYKPEFGQPTSLTEEIVSWVKTSNLPRHCVPNLNWLVPAALLALTQTSPELFLSIRAEYEYPEQD